MFPSIVAPCVVFFLKEKVTISQQYRGKRQYFYVPAMNYKHFSLQYYNFLRGIGIYCKMNELSTCPPLCAFIFYDFQLFDFLGVRVCHLLEFSVSWDPLVSNFGASGLWPSSVFLWVPFGVLVAPFLRTFCSPAAPCSGNLP